MNDISIAWRCLHLYKCLLELCRDGRATFSSIRKNDLNLPTNASDNRSDYSKSKVRSDKSNDKKFLATDASSHRSMLSTSRILGKNIRRRYFGERVPEIHLIGEIVGAGGYHRSGSLSCSWSTDFGHTWTALEGSTSGQTQYCTVSDNGSLIWNHPFDMHLTATTLNGWPRLLFKVWKLDRYGRINISGYGYCSAPSVAGTHNLTVECWLPCGSFLEEIYSMFMGTSNKSAEHSKYIFNDMCSSRRQLVTRSVGRLTVRCAIIMRYFDDQDVDL